MQQLYTGEASAFETEFWAEEAKHITDAENI